MKFTRRPLAAATVLAGTLALTGCGSNSVFNDGGVAASYKDTTVTTTEVSDAVADIAKAAPDSQFDGQSAVVYMVLGPELDKLAQKYGKAVSTQQARALFPKNMTPSDAAVRTAKGSLEFTSLRGVEAAQTDLINLIQKSDVKMNPRYGTWVKGKGPAAEPVNWIAPSAADAPTG
ncbi:hypothetical protein G9U51_07765 [Calidifontibacter sp. DB0510]|uniref:DUF1318 domain-containing protein n=1 Tax=Metallococcus carri TaxID=1656884 RepID=A0A967B0B4_9MICO|nr:hypothetical protein [Metallococcus carri]NHN55674.1 hypothetical protein [Metallococcus carri]NOP38142.1 hypothetical protein [Calidifontibacter sp. DB2511S]